MTCFTDEDGFWHGACFISWLPVRPFRTTLHVTNAQPLMMTRESTSRSLFAAAAFLGCIAAGTPAARAQLAGARDADPYVEWRQDLQGVELAIEVPEFDPDSTWPAGSPVCPSSADATNWCVCEGMLLLVSVTPMCPDFSP